MIFLGIDGGGSKTTFLLENQDGLELARFDTGPSNWLSSGADTARQSLADGIRQLPATPDVVGGGFAGAGRAEGQKFYQAQLSSLLPHAQIFIETDAFITYVGAIGLRPGVLLIAGTGSIALARLEDGTMVRTGGWGPMFGDEGSGFWIGREAIRQALRADDADRNADFVRLITDTLGLQTITDAPAAWKSGTLDVKSVAKLASAVVGAYPAEPARQILTDAASHLREVAETARRRAGLQESCTRCVSGSLGNQNVMKELIGLEFSRAEHPPARGAVLWARDRIKTS